MTNPVKTVTKQVQRLQAKMTVTFAILGLLISAILKVWKSSKMSYNWHQDSLYAEPYEQIYLTRKSIKFVKKTGVWAWDSWVFTNGS